MSTVITAADEDTPTIGGLLAGLSFFLTQRIPQRSHYMRLVQSNGGRVLRIEAQADYIVADHLRKDSAPGSVSYTFIEAALRDGTVPDPADHAAGPVKGTLRPIGSGVPGKSTRSPFTAEEDCMLYTRVERAVARGEAAKGNELYKKIEAEHPRHTHQSWRDRYIKKLHDDPPKGTFPGGFKQEDVTELLGHAEWIEDMVEDRVDEAWTAYAEVCTDHNAMEWAKFYQQHVRPVYRAKSKDIAEGHKLKKRKHTDESTVDSVHKRKSVKNAKAKLEQSAHERNSGRFQESGAPTPGLDVDSAEDDAEIPAGSTVITRDSNSGQQQQREDNADESVDGPEFPVASDEGHFSETTKTQASAKAATAVDDIDAEELFRREINASSFEAQSLELHTQKTKAAEPESLDSNVLTSDLNRAADQQVRRESIDESEPGSEAADATPKIVVSQLTEANLYSHHQGNKSPTIRGIDIPEDDESQDQEHYVSYLSSLIKKDSLAQAIPQRDEIDAQHTTTKIHSRHKNTSLSEKKQVAPRNSIRNNVLPESDLGLMDDDGLDLPNDTGVDLMNYTNNQTMQHHDSDMLGKAIGSDLPVSSQQELDVVGEGSILWPDTLDMANSAAGKENSTYSSDTQRQAKGGNRPQVTARTTHDEQEVAWTDVDYDSEEVDVDLTVVEPEGGFELSSPLKLIPPVPNSKRIRELENKLAADIHDGPHHRTGSHERHTADAARFIRSSDEENLSSRELLEFRRTLHEPVRENLMRTVKPKALETQDIVEMETQVLDLDIPLPSDSDDDDSSVGSVVEATPRKSARGGLGSPLKSPPRESSVEAWQDGLLSSDADDEQDTDRDTSDLRHIAVPPPAPTPPQQYAQSPLETQGRRNLGDVVQLVEADDVDEYITTLNIRHGFTEDAVLKALIHTSMRPELTEIVLFDERSGRGFPNDVPGIWSAEEDLGIESGAASRVREAEVKHGWGELLARLEFLREWRDT